jgi:lysophospholipase L1-like esterase
MKLPTLILMVIICLFGYIAGFWFHHRLNPEVNIKFCQARVQIYHERRLDNINSSTIIFLGDSHIEGLATSSITSHSENLGVSGETSYDLMCRLRNLKKSLHSNYYVICIGTNDILRGEAHLFENHLRSIIDILGPDARIFLLEPPPFSSARGEKTKNYPTQRAEIIRTIRAISSLNKNTVFIAFPNKEKYGHGLMDQYLLKDGIHVSREGYADWIISIRDALIQIQ